jgi:hypothetical protein
MTAKKPKELHAKRGRPPKRGGFYGGRSKWSLETALKHAEEMEGVDEEVDMLRVQLRELMNVDNVNFKLVARGMALLSGLLATRYQLSRQSKEELADNINGLIRGLAVQLYPGAKLDDP